MKYRTSLVLFALMFMQFAIITFNTIGIANHTRWVVFVTDLALTLLNFTILKQVIEAKSRIDQIAYALGGALGAQLAMVIFR